MLEKYENLRTIYNITKKQLQNTDKQDKMYEKYQKEAQDAKKELDTYYQEHMHELEKEMIKKEFNKDIDIYEVSYQKKEVIKHVKTKEKIEKEFNSLKTKDNEKMKIINSYKNYLLDSLKNASDIKDKNNTNILPTKIYNKKFSLIFILVSFIIHLLIYFLIHFIAPFNFRMLIIENIYCFSVLTLAIYYFYIVTATNITLKFLKTNTTVFKKTLTYTWIIINTLFISFDILINSILKYQKNVFYYFICVLIIFIHGYRLYKTNFSKFLK